MKNKTSILITLVGLGIIALSLRWWFFAYDPSTFLNYFLVGVTVLFYAFLYYKFSTYQKRYEELVKRVEDITKWFIEEKK